MTAPALATVLVQKVLYKGALAEYGLKIKSTAWRQVLLCFVYMWAIIIGTLVFIFIVGNILHIQPFGVVDVSNESFLYQTKLFIAEKLPALKDTPLKPLPFSPSVLLVAILLQGSISGSILNFPFVFGEELGWRGFLLHETRKWGFLKSNLFIGIIWGLWHAPVILMGHNFPGYPIQGIFVFTACTTALSFLLAYVRIKTKSIIGPCVVHGVLNAIGPVLFLYIQGASPLFGTVQGLAGIVVITVLCFILINRDKIALYNYSRS